MTGLRGDGNRSLHSRPPRRGQDRGATLKMPTTSLPHALPKESVVEHVSELRLVKPNDAIRASLEAADVGGVRIDMLAVLPPPPLSRQIGLLG
ncbi:hypothetical protein SAMN05519103_03397 [Rhizobiales bacterium GAS113]|jgi:hypothetical protein|nr:hypothetical protein SAMN05519103_03397 [Rhizobiales bacterium GAS113]